jgi:hypothetical protein
VVRTITIKYEIGNTPREACGRCPFLKVYQHMTRTSAKIYVWCECPNWGGHVDLDAKEGFGPLRHERCLQSDEVQP